MRWLFPGYLTQFTTPRFSVNVVGPLLITVTLKRASSGLLYCNEALPKVRSLQSGTGVGVNVEVGVGVSVAVDVIDGVNVSVGTGVFVATVGIFKGRGVLMARVARKFSTIPSR